MSYPEFYNFCKRWEMHGKHAFSRSLTDRSLRLFAMFLATIMMAVGLLPIANQVANATDVGTDLVLDKTNGDYLATTEDVIPATGAFAVEFWINPDSGHNQEYQHLIDTGGSPNFYVKLFRPDTAVDVFYLAGLRASSEFICGTIIPGTWTHVALSLGGTSVYCYVNGTLSGTGSVGTSALAGDLLIGRWTNAGGGSSWDYRGKMDQVKIWGSGLSEAQVKQSMDSWGSAGVTNPPSLLAHYDFNESAGATVTDRSGNGKDLTVYGSPQTESLIQESDSGSVRTLTLTRTYLASQPWQIPSGVGSIDVVALAGGGGASFGGADNDFTYGPSGGGGGELRFGSLDVSADASLDLVVGQGGGGRYQQSSSPSVGYTGLSTKLVGDVSGLLVSATGGSGGVKPTSRSNRPIGGAGGSAGVGLTGLSGGQGADGRNRNCTASTGRDGAISGSLQAGGGGGGGSYVCGAPDSGGAVGGGIGVGLTADDEVDLEARFGRPSTGGGAGGPMWGNGSLIHRFATSGGSGKLTLSYNLASAPNQVTGTPEVSVRLVDADSDSDSVSLSWSAVSGSPSVTSYVVEYSVNSDFSGVTALSPEPTTNSATITGLTDGVTYYFRVKARNSLGVSAAWSATATSTPVSNQDYVADFDGSFSAVSASTATAVPPSAGDQFTVEAWVKPDTITGFNAIFAQGQADGLANRFWLGFYYSNSKYYVHIGRHTSSSASILIPDPRDKWMHIATTVDGGSIKLYLDGQLYTTVTLANVATSNGVGIGSDEDGSGNKFDGQIDQVKVWDGVLEPSEVAASMHTWGKPSSGVDNTLRAHWDFNDFTNTTSVKDQAGSIDLTLSGAVSNDLKPLVTADTSSVPGHTLFKFTRSYLTATNGWTKPAGLPNTAKVVVAGGGGGGAGATINASGVSDKSGGGGAGGAINVNDQTNNVSSSTYLVKVGQGGAGGTTPSDNLSNPTSGANGESSVFGSFTGAGGGGGKDPITDPEMAGGNTSITLNGTVTNFTGGRNTNNWEGAGGGASAAAGLPTFSTASDHPGQGQRGQDGAAARVFADLGNLTLSGGGGGGSALASGNPPAVSNVTGPSSGGTGAGGGGGKLGAAAAVPAGSGQPNTAGGGGGAAGADAIEFSSNAGNGGSGVVILAFEALPAPTISSQPQNAAVLFNQSATFSVTATASNSISYQWQISADNSSFSNISGATSSSYQVVLNAQTKDKYYRVVVTNTAGAASESLESSSARLTQSGSTVGTGICEQGVGSSSGVVVVQDGNDCVIAFTTSGNNSWIVPAAAASSDVLIVAGGGGGGGGHLTGNHMNGGGGGAGGLIETTKSLTPGNSISLTVGAGGQGMVGGGSVSNPTKGQDSVFGSDTAKGGGYGSYWLVNDVFVAASSGGSGGGGGGRPGSASVVPGAAGTAGQGNRGGNGFEWNNVYQGSGGGGGAGAVGGNASQAALASGSGGAGLASSILNPALLSATPTLPGAVSGGSVYFAGGGGGGQRAGGFGGLGGVGGGGEGADPGNSFTASAATANTGGGGGGGTTSGADGGSGTIVIRYTAVHDVAGISPANGLRTSDVDVTITGSRLAFGATAKLTKSGESDVNLTNVVWVSSTQLTARITSGLASGTWNLVVTNPDGTTATLNSSYTATGNFDVAFTELDFDQDNINASLSCGTGKLEGNYQLYENVSTRNGVTVDGYVLTKDLSTGVTVSEYEDGANAGGSQSFFQIDVNVPRNPGRGFAVFEFRFFLDGTFQKGATCADPVSGTQVTLENVHVTGIDIDAEQYNSFSGLDSYTMASNTRLTETITPLAAPAAFPANGRFQANGATGSNDPRDQVISTYGEIETFEVTVGAESRGTAYFGVAFKALDWGTSTPQTTGQEFTLNYNANSGTGTAPASVDGGVGANITVATNSGNLTRSGFTFAGWNTRADGNGTTYAAGASFQMPQGGATLYAKWDQAQYSLSYNANGGSGAPTGANYAEGDTVTVSATTPTRTGFTFSGWNTVADGSGSNRTSGSTFVMPGSAVTLYALWTAISYTISYDEGDGSDPNGDPASHAGPQGSSFTVSGNSTTYTLTGHTFAGWNTAQDGSGQDYSAGQQIVLGSANVTLYAQWTAVIYNLTYHANGGSGAPAVQTAVVGQSVTITSTDPVRPGYTFVGWETLADGSSATTYGDTAPQTTSLTMPANNLTLYAIWTAVTYEVSYADNGGSGGPADDTGKTAGSTVTVGAAPTTPPAGQRFTGWSDGTNVYSPNQTFVMPANDLTLTAQWVLASIEVVYNAAGGTGAPAAADVNTSAPYSVSATEPTRTGYSFTGWVVQGGNNTVYRAGTPSSSMNLLTVAGNNGGTVTLVAQWSAINYTVTYNTQLGTPAVTGSSHNFGVSVTVSNQAVTRTGFDFLGWRVTFGGQTYMFNPSDTFLMPSENLTLTALWDAEPYTLTYNANGGSGAPSSEVRIFGSSALVSSTTPTRIGYTFSGWNTAVDGSGDPYSANQVLTMPASNVTLFAQWTVRNFAITFDDNGGTAGPADQAGDFGTSVTLSTTKPTRNGFTFRSWNTNCNGSGTDYAAGDTVVIGAADLALCAIWIGVDNSLIYNPNGGSGGPGTVTVATGATVTVSGTLPTRPGYSFSSWNTAADGSGTGYAATNTFAMPAGGEELFAIWIGNPFTVYFNANGGSGATLPQDIATTAGASETIPNTVPTRPGYTFDGWYANAVGTGTEYSGSFTMPAEDLVLYAKWEAISYTLTYNLNGSTDSAPADQAGILDEELTVASGSGLTKTGHWFAGWNTASDASGQGYAVGQSLFMPLGGDELFAVWVPDIYQIAYNANGGTGGPDLSASNGYDSAPLNSPYTILAENNIARAGYTFSHWSRSADGTSGSYENNGDGISVLTQYTPTANTTFYAQWIPATYTLTYDANTGSGSVPGSETLTYRDPNSGSTIVADPTLLSKAHANFVGWNTAAIGSGTAYSVGANLVMPPENLTLYAQWADVYYVVDFNPLGGTGSPSPIFATNSQQVTIPATEPVKTGFTFDGWELPGNPGTLTSSDSVTIAGSNVMLFAVYSASQGGGGGVPPVVVPPVQPPTVNPPVTPEVTPTPTPTPAPRPTPTVSPRPRPTQSVAPRPSVTPSPTPSVTPSQSASPSPSPSATESQVALPPRADRVLGEGLESWLTTPADPEAPRPIGNQAGSGAGGPRFSYDTGAGEPKFTESGALDLSAVKSLTTSELARERISGFAPNSGLYLEVLGSRTGARFVVTEANIIDRFTLIEAIRASIPAQAADFFQLNVARVGAEPVQPEPWTERQQLVAYDYFQASGLELPISLADLDFGDYQNWIEVSGSAAGYVPGTTVFLTLTSSPLVISQGTVDRFGNLELSGAIPVEYLELGEHRVRLVGIRSLGGVSVDDNGEIVISDQTMQEIERFDLGTQATVRLGGKTPEGDYLNAIRVVPLVPVAPWWTLWFILAGLVITLVARRRHWTNTRTKLIAAAGLNLASAIPAVVLGWLSTVTIVTWVGLALGCIAAALTYAFRPSEKARDGKDEAEQKTRVRG